MIRRIQYFECDSEDNFVVHGTVVPSTGESFGVNDIHSVVAQTTTLVRDACKFSDPSVEYAYDGKIMFVIHVSVDYSSATRDAGFTLLTTLMNNGWELDQKVGHGVHRGN
jgi:hypothetical protein